MVLHIFDPDGDVLLCISEAPSSVSKQDAEQSDSEDGMRSDSEDSLRSATKNQKALGSTTEMLVSSRHLILASKVFKSMLQPHFAEGLALQSNGTTTISLEDDDPYALEVMMNILHCRLQKVPQGISLNSLTQVAVVVDKYMMHDVAAYFAEIWVEKLEPQMPNGNCRNLHAWLCISWVFKMQKIFSKVTLMAFKYGAEGDLEDTQLNLPIPESIIAKIKRERERLINRLLDIVEGCILPYQADDSLILCQNWKRASKFYFDPTPEAAFQRKMQERLCDFATLGALIKGAVFKKMYPRPTSIHPNLQYAKVQKEVREWALAIPMHCIRSKVASSNGFCHCINETVSSQLQKMDNELKGLDLITVLSSSSTADDDAAGGR